MGVRKGLANSEYVLWGVGIVGGENHCKIKSMQTIQSSLMTKFQYSLSS